jgi:hypothetical protein
VVGPLLENAPTFSYAKIPEGMKDVPDYWKVLAEPVPPQQGLPHFRNIRISDVTAKGARQAFGVSAYPEATLRNFDFRNIDIEGRFSAPFRIRKTGPSPTSPSTKTRLPRRSNH